FREGANAWLHLRLEGPELSHQGQVAGAEDADVGAATAAGAGEDIGTAVAEIVAGRHPDAPGEGRVVGEEVGQNGGVGAATDGDVRPAARPGAGNDVVDAVAVDVARCHADAAGEGRIIGEEVVQPGVRRHALSADRIGDDACGKRRVIPNPHI